MLMCVKLCKWTYFSFWVCTCLWSLRWGLNVLVLCCTCTCLCIYMHVCKCVHMCALVQVCEESVYLIFYVCSFMSKLVFECIRFYLTMSTNICIHVPMSLRGKEWAYLPVCVNLFVCIYVCVEKCVCVRTCLRKWPFLAWSKNERFFFWPRISPRIILEPIWADKDRNQPTPSPKNWQFVKIKDVSVAG